MAFDYWEVATSDNTSELELRRYLCWDKEAPPKQSEGFGARHQNQISWLLVSLPLRSPKDMRRERPHPRVMQSNPPKKAKGIAKGKALAGSSRRVWAGRKPTALASSHGSGSYVASSTERSLSDASTCSCATNRHGTTARYGDACVPCWYASSRPSVCARGRSSAGGGCGSSAYGSCVK